MSQQQDVPLRKAALPLRRRRDALVFSRYVASCGIAIYHWYDRVPATHVPGIVSAGSPFNMDDRRAHGIMHWFSTWTSYFFILSGFVLAMARLTSDNPDDVKSIPFFVAERLTTTYPAYALTLVGLLLLLFAELYQLSSGDWVSFFQHVALVQAWVPPDSMRSPGPQENFSIVWNGPSWFMSALLAYWVLFKPLYFGLRRLPKPLLWPALVLCWVASGAAGLDAYFDHPLARGLAPPRWPRNAKSFADVYHYNPVFSINSFVGGMILSRLFCEAEASESRGERRALWRQIGARGAALAYAFLAVFAFAFRVPPSFIQHKKDGTYDIGGLFAAIHNGGLMPLHGLLIVGLCTEEENVAQLFSKRSFVWWGSISYEQYLFQTLVFKFLGDIFTALSGGPEGKPYDNLTWQFAPPLALTLVAMAAHYGFSVPVGKWLRNRLRALEGARTQPPFSQSSSQSYGAIANTRETSKLATSTGSV
ncbi:hypothetical protein CTAYLR_006791 [Chrysophaeum taylorii]|uniref:Acyltransferase 3 domain-containing protein n=1 Tax=Chrysophaeum taylorii TaxID=2483200 RepID=A0AAD7XFF5_9STRA|nr:hypothetical protein CTAYLR_006791 [Chrysophaeum taylorii]